MENDGRFHRLLGTDDPMAFLRGEVFGFDKSPVVPVDPYSLELGGGLTLIAPIDPPEVWGAGVTYERSRDSHMKESTVRDVYDLVYAAHRPELFLKDAMCRRTVGPGEPVGIRGDSTWNVPEPEIALVIGERGRILAYTIANDMSSREIEGANPLYLTQAKVYAGACAIGPALHFPVHEPNGFQIIMRISDEEGDVLYEDRTTTAQMVRGFEELATWLVKENPVPPGSLLLERHRHRPARVVQPRPGAVGGDPRPRGGDAREPCRARDDAPLSAAVTFLVTGVLGCLGAWVARCVLADGGDVVGFDLGADTSRLRLVLGADVDRVTLFRGDVTDLAALERAIDEHEVARVVHLAALQVPFVRANPPLGMRVNVAGTVNVFEAVAKRLDRIPAVAYASSAAVYGPSDPSPLPSPAARRRRPCTGSRRSRTRGWRASTPPTPACRRSACAPTSCTGRVATKG